MKKKTKDIWFARKTYGWGWTPVTWQGWAVIGVWIVGFLLSARMLDHEWLKNVAVMILMTAGLIWVCFKKGEKPGWRWGKK